MPSYPFSIHGATSIAVGSEPLKQMINQSGIVAFEAPEFRQHNLTNEDIELLPIQVPIINDSSFVTAVSNPFTYLAGVAGDVLSWLTKLVDIFKYAIVGLTAVLVSFKCKSPTESSQTVRFRPSSILDI